LNQPKENAMRPIARLLQMAGLTIPFLAIILELSHTISLGQMLVMLVAAICCFWIGRILEGFAN
jgi:hypothetical protein